MSRRIVPSTVLAALSLACTVRPRLMDDCPHRADARLVAPVAIELALKTVACAIPFVQGATNRPVSDARYKVGMVSGPGVMRRHAARSPCDSAQDGALQTGETE